jgi:hypothetical protein
MSGTVAIRELLRTFQMPRKIVANPSILTLARDHARAVVYMVDGKPVQALLPASLVVNIERLMSLVGASEMRLAREDEGAGSCAAELVFVDVRLALSHQIVFKTNASGEVAVMRWADFARNVRPIVGDFAEPPRDRVGAYRLSSRE